MNRLTRDREREIRELLRAFKHWALLQNDYEETHGPDMELLLAEISALREENEKLKVKIGEIESEKKG